MDKNKSAVDNFLGEFGENNDKVNPFEDTQKDPFAPQETVEQTEEEKEEKVPFHKDPKLQKFIDKEINRRMAEFKPVEVEAKSKDTEDEVSDVLTRLIGNDTPEKVSMVKEFKNILEKGTQRAKAEAIAELEARQEQEVEADREAEQELDNAFESIEETYDVDITSNSAIARKTRQEFVSFVEKIAPKDRNGEIVDYPDMASAWETYSEIKKSTATPNRAKELASRSMARSAEADTKQPERISWNKVDEFMDSLK